MKKVNKLILFILSIFVLSSCSKPIKKETKDESIKEIETKEETKNESKSETIKETKEETEKEKETEKEDINVSSLDTTSYAWSFAYPERLDLLKKYSGFYKINTNKNTIYLTFDNGYEYKNQTQEILDILKKKNVKTVFFTTSSFLESQKDTVKRMLKEGHIVANHTHKHLHHGKSTEAEIKNDLVKWEETYKKVIGSKPTTNLYRPPAGSYSELSLSIANNLGYKSIFWNFAYADWDPKNQPDEEKSLQKVLKSNEKGSIVLLHAVSRTNVDILERYIDETRKQGFEFGQLKIK